MKKSLWKKLMSGTLAIAMMLGMTACGKTPSGGTSEGESTGNGGVEYEEQIDTSKTQLYVYNYNGGFGTEWLIEAKERYEKLHENDVYEEGKKGIQIYLDPQKFGAENVASSIRDGKNEIYFIEYAYYYSLMSQYSEGLFADITDAVTGDLSIYGDPAGSTIESKMTEEQRNYFGIQENGETHYYGIPHYSGYSGIVYNVDLFEDKNYYFTANPLSDALEDQFIYSKNETRSAGPDGKMGTYDDGLPATYEQFFQLCEWISQASQIPVLWNGMHNVDYLDHLALALAADNEGKQQFMLNFDLSGQATSLGTVQGGKFVKDANPTTITSSNAYELTRQEGKYNAISFIEKLIKYGGGKYHNDNAFNTAYSHMDAQDDFLYAGHDGETPETAMFVEGVWWQNEAQQTFLDMTRDMGSSYSKNNRNFALMPLPKASADDLGGVTLYDHIYSMCFVKATIADWKKDIAMDFIKFVNTNESLIEFTQITDTPKALNYTMTNEQKATLSNFGRSVVNMKENADIVYPYSQSSLYVNNQSYFVDRLYLSSVGGIEYKAAPLAFSDEKLDISAEEYFNGLYTYRKNTWSTIN